MPPNEHPFALTTKQAARLLGVAPETLRVAASRGGYRGVSPARVNGRLMWTRSTVLALAGRHVVDTRTVVDLRATNPWLDSLDVPADDPVAQWLAVALNDPRDDLAQLPACRLDEWHAIRGWLSAARKRFAAARQRLTPEQVTDGQRLQALAVAAIVADLEPAVLAQAVADVLGGLK